MYIVKEAGLFAYLPIKASFDEDESAIRDRAKEGMLDIPKLGEVYFNYNT